MSTFPDYERPPVIEVVMGVQFAPISDLLAAHIGLYWSSIRAELSHAEEQPPIAHMVERTAQEAPETAPSVEISTKPPLPRVWFIDSSGTQLVQVQRDRFLFNWRKMRDSDAYPRYPEVKKRFVRHWELFRDFLGEENLAPHVDQFELTYVNHIKKGEGWDSMRDLGQLFTTFNWGTRSGFLPEPENVRWSMRFHLPKQMGRLHVDMAPVRVPRDNALEIRFSLTARGRPTGDIDPSSTSEWFDLAREQIVKGFADVVGEKTDALWGKRQ